MGSSVSHEIYSSPTTDVYVDANKPNEIIVCTDNILWDTIEIISKTSKTKTIRSEHTTCKELRMYFGDHKGFYDFIEAKTKVMNEK